jgi:GNAT superfamily N-acetyltransferase
MRIADIKDKDLIVRILTEAFLENKSVNYLIPNDKRRIDRIRSLMEYSINVCADAGKVLISDNNKAVALISFPEQKKTTLKGILWEAALVLKGIGIGNISKAMNREKAISANYPIGQNIYYLWFLGVATESQGKGIGTQFIKEIIDDARKLARPIYLETSTERNLPFYERVGFEKYNVMDFGYKLYLIKNKIDADR